MPGPTRDRAAFRFLPPAFAESLRRVGITVRRPVYGPREGMHRSPNFGSSVEFAEYREYSPGDPTNLIDWSVYARTDRYVVRRFLEETNLRAYILLDTSESLDFRDEGRLTKMEYACFLAAGLMFILVNQADTVALITFDHELRRVFEPVGTFEGLRPMLTHLEEIRPRGLSDIEACLHTAAESVRSKSLVIVISDLLQDGERVMRGVRHLHHDGHNIMVLHVLDHGERRLNFGGVAELRELESGRRMVIEVDEIRAAYEAAVRRHVDDLRIGCTECLADYRLVDTRESVEESLSHLRVQTEM
jgi:uncharacterized protein (DUF58 family)